MDPPIAITVASAISLLKIARHRECGPNTKALGYRLRIACRAFETAGEKKMENI